MTKRLEKRKIGLVPRIILAIILGIIVGRLPIVPEFVLQIFATFTTIFSDFLSFVIPFMIIGFVVQGIADLSHGAGKLLGITVLTSYISTVIGGLLAYLVARNLFPLFITTDLVDQLSQAGEGIKPLFTIPLEPFFDVTGAIIFAFMMGLGISWLRQRGRGKVLYEAFSDFGGIISQVLATIIVPLLPVYIFGNIANLAYTGTVFAILNVFWKVFICVLIMHLLYITFLFFVFGTYAGKNPIELIKNQIPGYMTALGTQSSAATIPVNVKCALKNGVSEGIANFVVPLCATIHLAGSIITITSCATTLLLIYDMPHGFLMMLGFILMLGVAMVAAPGTPGGAIMSALPFLPMIGIASQAMQQIMISLYITQDSFGTAANVSGDNAIAVFIDKIYQEKIKSSDQ
ncbi:MULTISPECIES: dicarboxylate/amino acid:cation symporter [Aerococcus]|uniref:dicarboxylate/amino acid:cation symporter n=1 Tax=Aerococcus TaxID=1375 RepID=UPI0018A704CB|nr:MULTISPECIES: dicarboxylate/amino acid:cation symporter [Aerococcus]MCY3035549.1 dicarboxylate/amino acid:cation symporter [Aerococcus sp. Group 2]MCY3039224.1 dicarboxylate/amino acid:cation symporter [Aerococcus sp. Group 2]MCY3041125.1 dicarboxylate/amino acid:cation symporter [Aerococcus sp. Group 2]MCY3042363.1 dicarboxylate/amino acid:cation symporter [Aerococcus sp. Group 2]MDK6521018.1 dicarboxylate/amino acid:cation symporter [Aerococcus urinae]